MIGFDVVTMLKAQQWERAKGELRAFVAMQGSHYTEWGAGNTPTDASKAITDRWQELDERVEALIKLVEDQSLHE